MSFWSRIFQASARSERFGGELSFKENLAALRFLPPFLKMIWETDARMATGNIVLRVIQAGIPVTALYIGKLIIDEVVHLMETTDASQDYLWQLVGLELFFALLSAGLSRGVSVLDALLGDKFANQTSVRLIEHAASMDLPQFEDSTFYDKLERARRQTTGRTMLLSQILEQVQMIISILFLAAGLVVFNPWLILLLIVAVIPAFVSETHFNQRSYSLARGWTPERRELDYLRFIGASDDTAKEIKIFGLDGFVRDRFAELADKFYQENAVLAKQRAGWGFVFNSLGDIGYYAAYVVIILQAVNGDISLGDLTFLSGSFERLRGSLRGVLSRFSAIAQSALYLQDLFDFFAIKPAISSPAAPRPFPSQIKEGFRFERVSFEYPNTGKFAIRDLSFTLQAGEKLALVGENGAGKTTLVKLLARLYDPSEGRILLDGHDLREYDLKALRAAVGVIFQDYVRFQLSAGDNIAVGRIEARYDQPRVVDAAHKSLADEVINGLPGQYGQRLGRRFEDGVELSGGQWQKIALGRAYMREAQLLILDEPTSALDARAEYQVFQRFAELTQGKSAVLISHRFSTVRMADRILVLEHGTLKEIGTHEELLAHGSTYAELFSLQAEGYR
jgi:ATP-binding cassette subfamily B protein